MSQETLVWDGRTLGPGPVALFLCDSVPGGQEQPCGLGAATNGTISVVLAGEQLSPFLHTHQAATIVTYDAAALHWLLAGHLEGSNNAEALNALWELSRECRLIDVMLLDQHVRRYGGEYGSVPSPLHRLIKRCVGAKLPDMREIKSRAAMASQSAFKNPDDPVIGLLRDMANGILQTYEHLLDEARKIEQSGGAFQLPDFIFPPPVDAEELAAKHKEFMEKILARRGDAVEGATEPQAAAPTTIQKPQASTPPNFGPLGIGIDVQAAIALSHPGRSALRVDPQQLDELLHENNGRFRMACARLYEDAGSRKCFHWAEGSEEKPAVCHDNGQPKYDAAVLKKWLRSMAAKLCDVHNLPVTPPSNRQGDPDFEPEHWGVWGACDRSLRAWRDLRRATRLEHQLASAAPLGVDYDVVPALRSPDLVALRSLRLPCFRPKDGNVFVVGRLSLLKARCFAAVCQRGRSVSGGRLAGHFLDAENPVGEIAGELYVCATEGDVPLTELGSDDAADTPADASFEEAADRFAELMKSDPDAHDYWLYVAHVFLEVIPMGLPAPLLSVVLDEDFELASVERSEVERLQKLLLKEVVYEIEDFLASDMLGRLARVLGLTPSQSVNLLAVRKRLDTINASLQNDLFKKRTESPVWRFIRKVRREQPAAKLPADDVIVERVLKHCVRTPAGRVIGPTFCAEARRQQVLLLADEVMKAVAYALVENGLPLAAVDDDQFVLEIPVARATDIELQQIARLAYDAGRRILGRFAGPCECASTFLW